MSWVDRFVLYFLLGYVVTDIIYRLCPPRRRRR